MSSERRQFRMPTDVERRANERSRELYDRAVAADEAGDLNKAVNLAKESLEVGRSSDDAFHQRFIEGRLADFLIRAGRADEARDILEASLATGAKARAEATNADYRRHALDIPASVSMLEQIYLATDDYDGTVAFVRARPVTEASEDNPLPFDRPGWILRLAGRSEDLAKGGLRDERAIDIAEQLARETGDAGLVHAVQHEQGAVAEALGDVDGAIGLYSNLLKAGSRYPETITRLLLLLERAGRSQEAIGIARSLIAEPLDREVKTDLQKRIDRLAKEAPSARVREMRASSFDGSTFGRRAASVAGAEDLLGLEAEEARPDRFADLDRITTNLISRRLAGQPISDVARRTRGFRLNGLSDADHQFLDSAFSRSELQARGAWFLPEKTGAKLRALSPSNDWRTTTDESSDTIYVWSLFGPLFEALHRPLELREAPAGKAAKQQKAEWQGVVDLFAELGIDARLELDVMAYGGGWSRLKADERRVVQDQLSAALVEWAPRAVRRYRAIKILELVTAYYAKADADGRALRTRVVTAALRPTVVAYFRGDWLAFLDYLGEKPHPGEQIVTSLPEARVVVAGSDRIAAAAAELGVSAEQAAAIGQSLWGAAESPVEACVRALKGYWATFDAIHARQQQDMPSLWGLVEERFDLGSLNTGPACRSSGMFRHAIPADILAEVDRLWGGEMVPQWPDRVLSAISPHFTAAETFGTALTFWHGVALTAWFVCEGPMSRTSIEDMETYYVRDLQTMDELGTPIDRALFRDLLVAKKGLRTKPREPLSRSTVEAAEGISFELSMSIGPDRLVGFEKLNDAITRHRRGWAAAYLEAYLRKRWDAEVRGAATTYSRMSAESNKPPTLKPFARKVESSVDHWFGGDISALYTAIGAKCPVTVYRPARVLPRDQFAFVDALVPELFSRFRPVVLSKDERAQWENNRTLSDLARLAIKAVQMSEALEAMPTLKVVGAPAFERAQRIRVVDREYRTEAALADDQETAFSLFIQAIETALARTPPAPVAAATVAPTATPRSVAAPIATTQPSPIADPAPKGLLGRLFGRR